MLLALLFVAHADTASRNIALQPRADGSASLLVAFRFSAGATSSYMRVQADSNHDGAVTAVEAEVMTVQWLSRAMTELAIESDGTPAVCTSTHSSLDLTGPERNQGFSIAVLVECPPSRHFVVTALGTMETTMRFAPASVSAGAVCPACAMEGREARRGEWFFVPGVFALLD